MHLIKKYINILLPLTIILSFSRVIPGVEFLYYFTPILLILFIISGYEQILINNQLKILIISFSSFGIWAALTSLWSFYPSVSLIRALYFLLVVLGASFSSALWFKERTFENVFGFTLPANIFIVLLSLFSLLFNLPNNSWTGGNGLGFMGFAIHQNTLGALILFTFPAPFYLFLKKISRIDIIKKENIINALLVLFLILLNILFIVLSHSRAALLSLFIGIFLVFILYFNFKQKLFFLGSLFLVVIILFTIPSLKSKFENYALKGTSHITANREILWKPSLEAAKIGGLFGIGYGTSAEEIKTEFQQIDEGGRLRREKGNSVLGLVEEVGIIGLILFIIPIVYVLITVGKQVYRFKKQQSVTLSNQSNKLSPIIYIAFLFAFIIHAQSEAWWVGTGSFSLLIFLMYVFLIPFIITKTTTEKVITNPSENNKQIS